MTNASTLICDATHTRSAIEDHGERRSSRAAAANCRGTTGRGGRGSCASPPGGGVRRRCAGRPARSKPRERLLRRASPAAARGRRGVRIDDCAVAPSGRSQIRRPARRAAAVSGPVSSARDAVLPANVGHADRVDQSPLPAARAPGRRRPRPPTARATRRDRLALRTGLANQLDHVAADGGIEIRRRLVENHQRHVGRQRRRPAPASAACRSTSAARGARDRAQPLGQARSASLQRRPRRSRAKNSSSVWRPSSWRNSRASPGR